jgi:predicted amidohydrolase
MATTSSSLQAQSKEGKQCSGCHGHRKERQTVFERLLHRPMTAQTRQGAANKTAGKSNGSMAAAFAVALVVVLAQIAQNQAMQAASTRIAVAQLTSKAVKWDNLIQVARCARWARRESCRMLFLPECFGFLGSSAAETLAAAEDPSFTRTNSATLKQLLTGLVLRGTDTDDEDGALASALADGSKIDAPLVVLPNQQVSLVDGLRTIAKASGMWISAGGVHVLATSTSTTETAGGGDDDDNKNKKVYNTHLILDETGEIRASYSKIHLFDVCIPAENVDLRESRTTAPGSTLVVCPDTPIGTCAAIILLSSNLFHVNAAVRLPWSVRLL